MTYVKKASLNDGLTIELDDLEYANKMNIKFGLLIGSGTYSHVYKAKYKSIRVAIKVCEYTGDVKRLVDQELSVFDILKENYHKNIIKFLEHFKNCDSSREWILMEWFHSKDMADKLKTKGSPFEENEAKIYFKQVVEGLKFLHSLEIVHRDIKLDNILIGTDANDNQNKEYIKIIDFGFAKKVNLKDDEDIALCSSRLGTRVYMAPEMLNYMDNQDYDAFKSDIYSLAVLLYVFLFLSFPERKTTEKGCPSNPFEFPEDTKYKVSQSVKQLILDMSCDDSVQRFNINQILDSDWMQRSD